MTLIARSEEIVVEIQNPKFYEKSLDDKAYEIKANKGFKKGENLKLLIIEGKFKTENGSWIYLKADKGAFSQSTGVVELEDKIQVYTEGDDLISSDIAKINMKNESIQFIENVEYFGPNRKISSDFSEMSGDFKNIYFEGNVLSNLNYDQ